MTGADIMTLTAASMLGGPFTSLLLELRAYATVYDLWKQHTGLWRFESRGVAATPSTRGAA